MLARLITVNYFFRSGSCKVRLIAARAELDHNDGVGGRCESGDVNELKEGHQN